MGEGRRAAPPAGWPVPAVRRSSDGCRRPPARHGNSSKTESSGSAAEANSSNSISLNGHHTAGDEGDEIKVSSAGAQERLGEASEYDGDEDTESHSTIRRGRRSIKRRPPPKGGVALFGGIDLRAGLLGHRLTGQDCDRVTEGDSGGGGDDEDEDPQEKKADEERKRLQARQAEEEKEKKAGEVRKRIEEEERAAAAKKAEEEEKRRAEAAEHQAQMEAARRTAEEAKRKSQEEAKRRAEEEAKRRKEDEEKRRAEEEELAKLEAQLKS